MPSLPQRLLDGMLRHFTTDQAVRAGVITAAWSAAASYSRGLLPRTPVQQAAATGVTVAAHYAIGATNWAGISSTAAGLPGSRAGYNALTVAAAATAVGGKAGEVWLRPRNGDNLVSGAAWSQLKLLSVVGLAGGLVTVSDRVAHDYLGLKRTPGSTLLLDLAMGGAMAGGTWIRRRRRSQRLETPDGPQHHPVSPLVDGETHGRARLIKTARTAAVAGGTVVGTTFGLATLAITEQAVARLVSRGLNRAAGHDLGEFGAAAGHTVTFLGFGAAGYYGLRIVREKTSQAGSGTEPGYGNPPVSPHVSCGPASDVGFDSVGKEGRRFVLMQLSPGEITEVMEEPASEPVRAVIPARGTIPERAALAVRELERLGGFDKGIICIASPTGVGYINYVMAEALEYLTRGDCAIIVPQYAYVPSALALNKTDEGTDLQRAVIRAIHEYIQGTDLARRPRLVQFGESLGAQVAVDLATPEGVPGFDEVGLVAGLYCGVPFRSSLWRTYRTDRDQLELEGRLILVSEAEELDWAPNRHVMIIHNDDPVNKFGYSAVVKRPWWMGPPETRPPRVPKETIFRPLTTFVLTLLDLLNGMNAKPGEFRLVAHDYRIDLRRAVQYTFSLPATSDQERRIEWALREREQEWAEKRLIARTADKALQNVMATINSWGQETVNQRLDDQAANDPSKRLVEYLNSRLGTGSPES